MSDNESYKPKHEKAPNACPKGGQHAWEGTGQFPRQTEMLRCSKCGTIGWD